MSVSLTVGLERIKKNNNNNIKNPSHLENHSSIKTYLFFVMFVHQIRKKMFINFFMFLSNLIGFSLELQVANNIMLVVKFKIHYYCGVFADKLS